MNPKKNIVLLLVLIVAATGFYLYDVKWAAEKKTEKERIEKVLKGIDKEKITRIAVERKNEPYQLIRTEKGWRFVRPIDAPVDSDVAEALLQAAETLKEEREIENAQNRADFGLEKSSLKINFGLKGQDDLFLEVGNLTPTKNFRYASLKDGPVFTTGKSTIDNFDKPILEIRDRTILPLKAEDAKKIVVEPEDLKPFAAVRLSKEKWELIEPVKAGSDIWKTEDIINNLRFGKVHRFIEEDPKDVSVYGLAPARYTVRIFTDKAGKIGDGILLGKGISEEVEERGKKTKKQFFYGRRISGGPVFLVPEKIITDLPLKPFDIRDKKILDYDVDHVTRLKLELPGEAIDARRVGKKKWELDVTKGEGETKKITPYFRHVDDVLWDIKWAKVIEFADTPGEDLTKYGLAEGKGESAVRKVTLWIKEKKEGEKETPEVKKSFTLGALLDGKKAYGRMEGQKGLFAFKAEDVKKILKDGFALSDRRLVIFEDSDDIAKLSVEFPGGKRAEVARNDEGWELKAPSDKKPNLRRVIDLLLFLKDLEYVAVAKEGDPFDFEKFRVRIALEDKKGNKLGPLVFAQGEKDNRLFVRLKKESRVLMVEKPSAILSLPPNLEALIDQEEG